MTSIVIVLHLHALIFFAFSTSSFQEKSEFNSILMCTHRYTHTHTHQNILSQQFILNVNKMWKSFFFHAFPTVWDVDCCVFFFTLLDGSVFLLLAQPLELTSIANIFARKEMKLCMWRQTRIFTVWCVPTLLINYTQRRKKKKRHREDMIIRCEKENERVYVVSKVWGDGIMAYTYWFVGFPKKYFANFWGNSVTNVQSTLFAFEKTNTYRHILTLQIRKTHILQFNQKEN